MEIKKGTEDQGWALVDRLDEFNRLTHQHSGTGTDLSMTYVIKKGDQVVGGIEASSDDHAVGCVEMLWIDESYRRKGLGFALLTTVEQELQNAGCQRVHGQCIGGIFGYSSMYRIGSIESLWVDEEFRHKGTGTALVNALVKALRDFGCPTIHLDTMSYRAPEFYQSQGFKQFGKLTYPENGVSEFFSSNI